MEEKLKQKIISVEEKSDKHIEESDLNLKDYEDKTNEAEKELNIWIEVAGNRVMADGYAKYANKAHSLILKNPLFLLYFFIFSIIIIIINLTGELI